MKERVSGSVDVGSIKRCYVDCEIEVKCPDCGEILTHDFNEQYLSHPEIEGKDYASFYCSACEDAYVEGKNEPTIEWILPIKIISADLVIEYDKDKITKDEY